MLFGADEGIYYFVQKSSDDTTNIETKFEKLIHIDKVEQIDIIEECNLLVVLSGYYYFLIFRSYTSQLFIGFAGGFFSL